jgi:hypothetical protein
LDNADKINIDYSAKMYYLKIISCH